MFEAVWRPVVGRVLWRLSGSACGRQARITALAAALALAHGPCAAQVFIQGGQVSGIGTTYTDTAAHNYPDSGATIIRLSGAGSTYRGADTSGNTVSTGNIFRGVEAAAGTQAFFTGLTTFDMRGTGTTANAFRAAGGSISAERAILSASGTSSVVDVSTGGTVNLGTASTLTAADGIAINLTGAGSSLSATNLTVGSQASGAMVRAGTTLTLLGTANTVTTGGVGVTVAATGAFSVEQLAVSSGGTALLLQGAGPYSIGAGSRYVSSAGNGIQSTAAGATLNGSYITASGVGGIVLAASSSLTLGGASAVSASGSGNSGAGLTLNANAIADLGIGSRIETGRAWA